MNIYVGNLAHAVTEEELRQAFEVFGEVAEARLIIDKFSGKSKGFGFVEMPSKEEAEKAIEEMNGKELKERTISVNEAKPKTDRPSGGRGGRGGRGGSGGGGYGGNRGGSGGGNRY
jgi:RNA recognition motif-containing protein